MLKKIYLCGILAFLSSCYKNQNNLKDADELTQITVIHEKGQTIKEFRNKGRLFMVEVTPKHGKTYIIYPDQLKQKESLYDQASPVGVHWKIKDF